MVKQYEYRPGISNNNSNKVNSYNDAQLNYLKNKVFLENKGDVQKNNNAFMNLTIKDIYENIINLLPNLYNDYHKKYLETSLNLKNENEYVTENIIVRETLISLIFNSKNIIYLGIVIILLSFLLYMVN
jgi:hypothetical protein